MTKTLLDGFFTKHNLMLQLRKNIAHCYEMEERDRWACYRLSADRWHEIADILGDAFVKIYGEAMLDGAFEQLQREGKPRPDDQQYICGKCGAIWWGQPDAFKVCPRCLESLTKGDPK